MKTITHFLLVISAAAALSSCSVVMAAKKEGVSLNQVQSCRTRGQIISCGATIISSERLESGELVEAYQIPKERGSAARALMHGALDVSTLGLWEVVGTPIEACDTKEYFAIKVFYDLNENIKKVELI